MGHFQSRCSRASGNSCSTGSPRKRDEAAPVPNYRALVFDATRGNISATGLRSAEFCARLLEQEKVAAVPGITFGADDYLRIIWSWHAEPDQLG